jgi:predicted O-linked N-acetylglucosamine transferase (SPINDLY family)
VTFGSFNNLQKLSADTIAAWSRILGRVPDARLSLKSSWLSRPGAATTLRDAFAAHGVAPARIDLSGWLAGSDAHLGAYGGIDVALDPFPYNGTTTTLEALWMGVPVIALRGDRHAARVGASLLTGVGAEELIAVSIDDYVDRATALAMDGERCAAYRRGLRARLAASPAVDAAGFARTLEAAYRRLWRDWCSGPG